MNKQVQGLTKIETVRGLLEKMKPEIQKVLPKHLDPARIIRMALTDFQTVKHLNECTPESFLGALMECSQLGLEPGRILGEAYLLPFKNKMGQYVCKLIPGYRGLLTIARRSGEVKAIYARPVFQGDEFEYWYGLDEGMKHKPTMAQKGPLQYGETLCNFYPLYDWQTKDIWVANAKFNFDYNQIYDLYYQAGLNIDQMRVASPFHQSGQNDLKLYKVIDPKNWGKMVGRVNGCNFGGLYGGTTAMGWQKITKLIHFTWKQYAEFLISTLPETSKKKLLYHLGRLQETWNNDGYGRNPDVISRMREEGIEVDNTRVICKKCTKPNIYEIVKIKSGFPDETKVHSNFRICPSWKAVCITIMKNDFTCTYLGAQRTKDQNLLKRNALKKYQMSKRGENVDEAITITCV